MEPAPEVRDVYVQYTKALSSGDASSLLGTFSQEPGVIEIGSAPDAWTEGHEDITDRLTDVFRGLAGTSIEPGDVKAFQEGTVAWLADRPTLTTPDGMRVFARITAVFRREDGAWKIVQSHFSMGRRLG
jgi:ketosteroid isomerase-like protein